MSKHPKTADLSGLYPAAIRDSFGKLDPRLLWKNPVIFVTAVVATLTTILGVQDLLTGVAGAGTSVHIALWLWLCVLFANFAEALAEGRGKARADTLRATKSETRVRVLSDPDHGSERAEEVLSTALRPGQIIRVSAGEIIPTDGEVVRGMASVNESAITGESAPVIREAGGDRSGVTGGTTIVSDRLMIRVTAEPGKCFLDRMFALVEGAERQKTPNELALNILLVGLPLIFLFVVVTLPAFASYSGTTIPVIVLGALFVTLIPTTIGGLLSAIGIAGMDRLVKANVIAKSGRAVEAAGDVDTLLLDKTGTITFGNRHGANGHSHAPDWLGISACDYRGRAGAVLDRRKRQPDRERRNHHRINPDRAAICSERLPPSAPLSLRLERRRDWSVEPRSHLGNAYRGRGRTPRGMGDGQRIGRAYRRRHCLGLGTRPPRQPTSRAGTSRPHRRCAWGGS